MHQSPIHFLNQAPKGYTIGLLREDLIDPLISGNKYRKLKYALKAFQQGSFQSILTFGGAFSNHLLATAAAGYQHNIPTIGIVRGAEWQTKIEASPTLAHCKHLGMELQCVAREQYAQWTLQAYQGVLPEGFEEVYMIPEGGSNEIGVQGCTEILGTHTAHFDNLCVCVGTGATLAGIAQTAGLDQQVLGFLALKHRELKAQIQNWANGSAFELLEQYTFGGYAKIQPPLVDFMNRFYEVERIALDPIYTGKMLFGIFDLIQKHQWNWGTKILAIHTGGLQGLRGMHQRLLDKGEPGFTYLSAWDGA